MIEKLRQAYNAQFTEEKYQRFLAAMNDVFDYEIPFRIAETPIFVPKSFKSQLLQACEEILTVIQGENFKEITARAIPPHQNVPHEDEKPTFLTIDFAVCKDAQGEWLPQLIEMQGFPSLYGYQDFSARHYRQYFEISDTVSHFLDGFDKNSYDALFKQVILGNHPPENVILLEIEPHKQKTRIDFLITEQTTGIKAVCISEIIKEGKQLFYLNEGQKTPIYRIYNRLIFDELEQRTDLKLQFKMTDDVDVEWAGHPNWFFRMSKFTMPFVDSVFVPKTYFLNELAEIPQDLENYVLKPLFSFAGAGVKFDVTMEDIAQIPENQKSNFILQRKVQYATALHDTQGEPIKTEIRMMFLQAQDQANPQLVMGLGRLSKGKMIGVDFNKDKTWVGGTAIFFEI